MALDHFFFSRLAVDNWPFKLAVVAYLLKRQLKAINPSDPRGPISVVTA